MWSFFLVPAGLYWAWYFRLVGPRPPSLGDGLIWFFGFAVASITAGVLSVKDRAPLAVTLVAVSPALHPIVVFLADRLRDG